jgi:uncharacterized protein (TIRG00374 family)
VSLRRFAPLGAGLAAVAAIAVWLGRTVEMSRLLDALGQARLGPLLLMAAAMVLSAALRALRLNVVLQNRGGFAHTFHANNIGQMVNCLLPLRSGEICTALLLGARLPGGRSEALSRLFVDRLLDVIAVLALFAVTLPLLDHARTGSLDTGHALLFGGAGVAAIIAGVWLLCAQEPLALRGVRWTGRLLGRETAHWEQRVAAALDGLRVLFRGRVLILAGGLSFGVWLLAALSIHIGIQGLFPSPGFICAVVTVCIIVLGLMVAPMPAGIGTTHGAIVLSLGLFGLGAEQALAFAVLYHAVATLVWLAMGLLSLRALDLRLLPLLKNVFAANPAGGEAP